MTAPGPRDRGSLLVLGTGLIGASLALAARRAGYQVWLDDADPAHLALAVSLGAGEPREELRDRVDLAVVAVPPAATGGAVASLLVGQVADTVTHVASVQLDPERDVESRVPSSRQYVGGHPIAGRERSGPQPATPDLFADRPWIVCPAPASAPSSVAAVSALARACGAVPTTMTAQAHDELFARLSHVPQLVASALAASLVGLDPEQVALAGTGLRDTSRLADSDPRLWADVVLANAAPVRRALLDVSARLESVLTALDGADPATVRPTVDQLLRDGNRGRALLSGKHGGRPVSWAMVSVVVPDEPGALARLLTDASEAEVNVEDIRVDHAPGQPKGVAELAVAAPGAEELQRALVAAGWVAVLNPPRTA